MKSKQTTTRYIIEGFCEGNTTKSFQETPQLLTPENESVEKERKVDLIPALPCNQTDRHRAEQLEMTFSSAAICGQPTPTIMNQPNNGNIPVPQGPTHHDYEEGYFGLVLAAPYDELMMLSYID
jgi:hypothetical protein